MTLTGAPCALLGTGGDDVLRGTPGRDWLQGEDGDDDLHGGGGDDRYVLGPRFGTTYVFEDGGNDIIQFLALERRDVVLERDGDDAVLRFPGHGRVHVRDHFRRDAYKVERVEFASGPPLTREDLDLIGEDDVSTAGELLEPGDAAALLVWEDLWAAPFVRAARNAGGVLLAHDRIPVDVLETIMSYQGDES